MIDATLVEAFIGELEALRTHGRDIARMYPDIASALDIDARRSRDPSVERIVESTAFIGARLKLLIDANATELPAALLAMLAPVLTEPVPSMAIAEFDRGTEPRTIPRGARFDYHVQNRHLCTFSTTTETIASPLKVRTRRIHPAAGCADAIALELDGTAPAEIDLHVGRDDLGAATILDTLRRAVARIEIVYPNRQGPALRLPASSIRFRGFATDDRALPDRPAGHRSHRLVTEFVNFPEKFRFITVTLPGACSSAELRVHFRAPLALEEAELDGAFTANRVPVVNHWRTTGTPFYLTGRSLEYPVRVDAPGCESARCHSVEHVEVFHASSGTPTSIDPIVAHAHHSQSPIEWGTRRGHTRTGEEVFLFFRGLDYEQLGRERVLVATKVIASNATTAQGARAGTTLRPSRSIGDWRTTLLTRPTLYQPAPAQSESMRALCAYLQSSMKGLCNEHGQEPLREYLRRFPGAGKTPWINAIGDVAVRPVLTVHNGRPRQATRALVSFDAHRAPATSSTILEAVLQRLFDTHRRLNSIEEVRLVAH